MPRRKRNIKRHKKSHSPASQANKAMRMYILSGAKYEKWNNKIARKEQAQFGRKFSQSISIDCPFLSYSTRPTPTQCAGCNLYCSYNYNL